MIGRLKDIDGLRFVRLGHRNGGVVLSVFLVLFAITGVLLNHTEDLGLDHASVPAFVASRYYKTDTAYGFSVDSEIFYSVGDTLFMGKNAVDICTGNVLGAERVGADYVVLCGDLLVLLAEDGTLIERLGAGHGVPPGATAMTFAAGGLYLKLADRVVKFDLADLSSTPADGAVSFRSAIEVPMSTLMTGSVSWEQFILDLHSGQFLGRGGVWLSDFLALLLVLLGISGVVMFLRGREKSQG